jgi:hypothetical protein
MKKRQVDHVLRAAGRITREKRFVIVGSQALHGTIADLADEIVRSAEVDLIAHANADRTEWLNAIGQDSSFHVEFGYYADPVDESTATLPAGWKDRLVPLAPGDTEGVEGLCLDAHDLAIAKYAARREQDLVFTRELVRRRIVKRTTLIARLEITAVDREVRERIRQDIERDFAARRHPKRSGVR